MLRSRRNTNCRFDPPAALFPVLLLLTCLAPRAARPQALPPPPEPPPADEAPLGPPLCKASSAILVDAVTGTVLFEKNARVRRPIASTTKIMTAMLLLESGRLDEWVPFTEHARQTPYASLNAKPGEKIRLRDLLYAILLRSSNDGCVAAAEHVAGAAWKFTSKMTARARELGAADTNFVTTNGLYDPQHLSTAYDLALITRCALRNPLFSGIVATQSRVIERTINQKDTLIKNHNKFLTRYQGADGVKTGYVKESGRCLVASSTRGEQGNPWRLITVVLNSPDTYGDSARLMDWGRQYFQPVFFARSGQPVTVARVKGGEEREVPLIAPRDLMVVVRRREGLVARASACATVEMTAPVAAAQVGGKIVALLDGRPVGQMNLVAARQVERVWTASVAASVAPLTGWSVMLGALVLGPRYARAIAKSARRRRRRLAARGREPDFRGQSLG